MDPILKERMFGLSGPEGNHGEDVKETGGIWTALPPITWHTWRYHYPQGEFPYADLVAVNGARSRAEPEYELVDTGIFDDGRYWVVTVDYAKAAPHDLLMRITVENAGLDEATIDVLPTLWFRNTWSWGPTDHRKPSLHELDGRIVGQHDRVGALVLAGDGTPDALDENETNVARLDDNPDGPAYARDGINDHVVHGAETVNPDRRGTKAALCYRLTVPAGGSRVVRVRLVAGDDVADRPVDLADGYDAVMVARQSEADAFYSAVARPRATRRRPGCSGRRSPGCCGASSSTTSRSNAGWTGTQGSQRHTTGSWRDPQRRLAAPEQP